MLLESKASAGFTLTIYQARLDISVSSLGTMNPQIQINYSGLSVKTKSATGKDRLPSWSEAFNFEYLATELELVAIHKPLLLKDIEIGRCKVNIEETLGWFELRNNDKKVGSIRISIKEDKETLMSTGHSSKDSWELREDYNKKLNDLELEKEEAIYYKKKYKLKLEKLRQQKRKSNSGRPSSDELTEVIRTSLYSSEIENSDFVGKLQSQIRKLQKAQEDLNKRKELLKAQEENILNEKNKISVEWNEIKKARQEFAAVKQKINEEGLKIRNEQEKVANQSKLVEASRTTGIKSSRDQQRYNQIINRINCIGSPELMLYENLTERRSQSIEELHEKAQINRVPFTVEKPRPPLHPLSANSSRLIAFE